MSGVMIILPILMKINRHRHPSLPALAARAQRLPAPTNYYDGCRCPPLNLPDRVLLFCRHNAQELQDGSLQPHFHHRWVLMVALRGAGTVHVDGRRYRLGPGRTLLVPPLRLHRYERVDRGRIAWLFITFELPLDVQQPATPQPGRLTAESRARLRRILTPSPGNATTLTPLPVEVGLLLQSLARPTPTAPPPAPRLVERIQQWLLQHTSEPVTVAALARELAVSPSHLRAQFRQQYGMSLGRYLRETRCRLAAVLLKRGDRTVTETAAALGFQSVYAFSRTFKRILGMPPSALQPGK